MADSFLVLVPHKTLHGTISILIQRPKLATNVGKMGAVKNKMPFIPQCPGPAQSADGIALKVKAPSRKRNIHAPRRACLCDSRAHGNCNRYAYEVSHAVSWHRGYIRGLWLAGRLQLMIRLLLHNVWNCQKNDHEPQFIIKARSCVPLTIGGVPEPCIGIES